MFNLANVKKIKVAKENVPVIPAIPSPIEGSDLLYELLPVSKVTGHRSNTLTLLRMSLSPKYQGLIPQILQELPTIPCDKSLTDEERCQTLAIRLLSGTPAESENFVRQMMNVIDDLNPQDVQQDVKPEVVDPSVEVNPE